jgi:hypothetical protein
MADNDHDAQPTQKTQPKKGDPVEIPIPTRDAVLRDLMKVAPRPEPKKPSD